jgi:hypothetical protein
MQAIEQIFIRLFSILGKAFDNAKPGIDSKLDEFDKWVESKAKPKST